MYGHGKKKQSYPFDPEVCLSFPSLKEVFVGDVTVGKVNEERPEGYSQENEPRGCSFQGRENQTEKTGCHHYPGGKGQKKGI